MTGPQDPETEELIHTLRDDELALAEGDARNKYRDESGFDQSVNAVHVSENSVPTNFQKSEWFTYTGHPVAMGMSSSVGFEVILAAEVSISSEFPAIRHSALGAPSRTPGIHA